jgi:hypothetical protein
VKRNIALIVLLGLGCTDPSLAGRKIEGPLLTHQPTVTIVNDTAPVLAEPQSASSSPRKIDSPLQTQQPSAEMQITHQQSQQPTTAPMNSQDTRISETQPSPRKIEEPSPAAHPTTPTALTHPPDPEPTSPAQIAPEITLADPHSASLAGGAGISLPDAPKNSCQPSPKRLLFSANKLPPVPNDKSVIWGGNVLEGMRKGSKDLYGSAFIASAAKAHAQGLETFAYLEGKCGLTGGKDDGEIAKRRSKRPNWDKAGWKSYTWDQLEKSGAMKVDHCEIDNLPDPELIALMTEYQKRYDQKKIHCKLVLKNIKYGSLAAIKAKFGPGKTDFISPFAISEKGPGSNGNDSYHEKMFLNHAEIKDAGAKTLINTNTHKYGDTMDRKSTFLSCKENSSVNASKPVLTAAGVK